MESPSSVLPEAAPKCDFQTPDQSSWFVRRGAWVQTTVKQTNRQQDESFDIELVFVAAKQENQNTG